MNASHKFILYEEILVALDAVRWCRDTQRIDRTVGLASATSRLVGSSVNPCS